MVGYVYALFFAEYFVSDLEESCCDESPKLSNHLIGTIQEVKTILCDTALMGISMFINNRLHIELHL